MNGDKRGLEKICFWNSLVFAAVMEGSSWVVLFLMLSLAFTEAWKVQTRWPPETRNVHNHRKREMATPPETADTKKRSPGPKLRDNRKKPSGHLTPLEEDDIDNDDVVSVAVGPPPVRPKYDKLSWKKRDRQRPRSTAEPITVNQGVINLVKDVLMQLGRDFLTRQVNEDFVFGQYVGKAMRGLSSELKLKMQHDVLELIVKYQKLNSNGTDLKEAAVKKLEDVTLSRGKKSVANDTEDIWPDFTNLANIVG